MLSDESDEGMAHAMQYIYKSAKFLAELEGKFEALYKRNNLNNLEAMPHWNAFWTAMKGKDGAMVHGKNFTLTDRDFFRVRQHFGAQLSCKKVAQILNQKHKSECISFFCGTEDEDSEYDYLNPQRYYKRVYLKEPLPDRFR